MTPMDDLVARTARGPATLRATSSGGRRPERLEWAIPIGAFLVAAVAAAGATASELRGLSDGQRARNVRLGALRTLDDDFPFQQVDSRAAWAARAAALRLRVRGGPRPLAGRFRPRRPPIQRPIDRRQP